MRKGRGLGLRKFGHGTDRDIYKHNEARLQGRRLSSQLNEPAMTCVRANRL